MSRRGNVIKEYLVSLGFDVDDSSFARASDAMKRGAGQIDTITSKLTSNLVKTSAGILSFVATAAVSVAGLVESVAKADIQMQTAANSKWMNPTAYRDMAQAVESMGYSMSDLQDGTIARSEELTNRFRELYSLSQETSAPKELDSSLVKVRDIVFQFQKLRVVGKNAIRQVAYYFLKYMGKDLDEIHDTLAGYVDYLKENLPKITLFIAKLFYIIFRFAKTIKDLVSSTLGFIVDKIKRMPSVIKAPALAFAATLFLMFNPIYLAIAAIAALILIWDDWNTYKKGGESFFDWQGIDNFLEKLDAIAEKIKFIKELLSPTNFKESWGRFTEGIQQDFRNASPFKIFQSNQEARPNLKDTLANIFIGSRNNQSVSPIVNNSLNATYNVSGNVDKQTMDKINTNTLDLLNQASIAR